MVLPESRQVSKSSCFSFSNSFIKGTQKETWGVLIKSIQIFIDDQFSLFKYPGKIQYYFIVPIFQGFKFVVSNKESDNISFCISLAIICQFKNVVVFNVWLNYQQAILFRLHHLLCNVFGGAFP